MRVETLPLFLAKQMPQLPLKSRSLTIFAEVGKYQVVTVRLRFTEFVQIRFLSILSPHIELRTHLESVFDLPLISHCPPHKNPLDDSYTRPGWGVKSHISFGICCHHHRCVATSITKPSCLRLHH